MCNADIVSMPDKWEYPWYAAWGLAFHVVALTLVVADLGKGQRMSRLLASRPELTAFIHDPAKAYLPAESDTGMFGGNSNWRVPAPVYGATEKFRADPYWRDLISFFEYFHGDNGAGLGASHQTGWTGVVARGMHLFATTTAEQAREEGKQAAGIAIDRK